MSFGRIKHAPLFGKRIRETLCAVFVVCVILLCCIGCTPFFTARNSTAPTTLQSTSNSALTYVAIGASDTFGIGADDPSTENWPTDLTALLKQPVHLINLGIPDIVLHDALNTELPVALDAHPTLVTVWLAVNDLAANVPVDKYTHDLDLLLARLHAAAPHARIAVGNVPDLTLLPHFQSFNKHTLTTQILAYNSAISTVVAHHAALLVDLYHSELAQHPEYISDDGFHPNALGYTRVAQLFYQVLKS